MHVINCNKCLCLCIGSFYKFHFTPMYLGLSAIAWCEQLTYLGVVINAGKTMSFDINQTRRSFFIACNSIFSNAPKTNELLHLNLQETYSLLIFLYAAPALAFNSRQLRNLNCCWNLVYRRIFGFNTLESVKSFKCKLGRLDFYHLLLARRTNFYRHLLTVDSFILHVLFRNFCNRFYNYDEGIKLAQLSRYRAQTFIRVDYQQLALPIV